MADRDRKPVYAADGRREQSGEPLLTIGIIFKNEIRCIRRCLDSLRPLREAVPCELIMADTGSADGSRAVAEEHADVLFDFPWIDDFAAARNAVLNRASGAWYLSIDCDEWLADGIEQLAAFLRTGQERQALLPVRNLETYDWNGPYTEFPAARLFRRTDGAHYQDPIHEYVIFDTPISRIPPVLTRVILNHDGYVALHNGGGGDKRRRNLDILRRELEKNPEDLRTLRHFLELGRNETEYGVLLERAMRLTEARAVGWDSYGVMVFRDALAAAVTMGWPQLKEWGRRAETAAPEAFCLRTDGNFILANRAAEEGDWQAVLRREEAYLSALRERDSNPHWRKELLCGSLLMDQPRWVQEGRIQLARALAHTGQTDRALELLAQLRGEEMEERQIALGEALLADLSGAADADLLRRLAVETGAATIQAARWAEVLVRAADREAARAAERQTEREKRTNGETEQAPFLAELLQLAEQVRTILSAYPPDDPAVLELKRSPVYRRVAGFIEKGRDSAEPGERAAHRPTDAETMT